VYDRVLGTAVFYVTLWAFYLDMSEERCVLSTLITMLRESFPEGNLGITCWIYVKARRKDQDHDQQSLLYCLWFLFLFLFPFIYSFLPGRLIMRKGEASSPCYLAVFLPLVLAAQICSLFSDSLHFSLLFFFFFSVNIS
jgi:hypothetical protein